MLFLLFYFNELNTVEIHSGPIMLNMTSVYAALGLFLSCISSEKNEDSDLFSSKFNYWAFVKVFY